MISITTSIYDLSGQVIVQEDINSELKRNTRRASRTPTLDGGCSIIDQGFSHSDRTLNISKTNIDQNSANILWYLFQTYSLVQISIPDGCYKAVVENMKIISGNLTMKILLKEVI